jgi:hypothetical protein
VAGLLLQQHDAVRARDVDAFVAATGALESACGDLGDALDAPATPLEQAWATVVQRLNSASAGLYRGLDDAWREFAVEMAESAGPVQLDLRV